MQIMRKLFFSLLLGTLVAICWVLIIHTLKWIALKGNEFEASLGTTIQPQASASSPTGVIVQPPSLIGDQLVHQGQPLSASRRPLHLHLVQSVGQHQDSTPQLHRLSPAAQPIQGVTQPAETGATVLAGHQPKKIQKNRRRKRRRRTAQAGSSEENDEAIQEVSLPPPPRLLKQAPLMSSRRRPSPFATPSPPPPVTWPSDLLAGAESAGDESDADDDSTAGDSGPWLSPGGQQQQQPTSIQVQRPTSQVAAELADRSGQFNTAGLMYKAPFFTSWFVSIWNILFMPIFTLISSCCFRNEDSTTKKLLV